MVAELLKGQCEEPPLRLVAGATGNLRYYDAWGAVRTGYQQTGHPLRRYTANLGHVQDDESGLIYMRARYYEPTTGRFISQDPVKSGHNWYLYGENNPELNSVSRGQVSSVDMSFSAYPNKYFESTYTYSSLGERESVEYSDGFETWRIKYWDYVTVGYGDSP